MDPLTAIGLAANILAFIDFGIQLVKAAKDIHDSAGGSTKNDEAGETAVREMKLLASKLQSVPESHPARDYEPIRRLAVECYTISGRILALLERIKPKNALSKTQAVRAALKSKYYEKEKLELQEALDNCRAQLLLQLHCLDSTDSTAKLKALIESSRDNTSRLESLSVQIVEVQHQLNSYHLGGESKSQLSKIFQISNSALDMITQEKILRAIAFENMTLRYEAVEEAHLDTFRWILDDTVHEVDEERIAAKKLFTDWLLSGSGIFHISGKLGAGKSTLMKFLCENNQTNELLKQWAGEKPLIFSNFFFWKPGSSLQKSLQGLIRSLLYATLKAVPELIPYTLPMTWSALQGSSSGPWHAEIPVREIFSGFAHLMMQRGILDNYRLCFFIDGLDEYEGDIQTDTKFMVEQLSKWSETHKDSIKLCVSSREYNVFMNAFSPQLRLQLHKLTRKDMENYTRARLACIPNNPGHNITDMIVSRADGIFLWVALATRSMREQFEDGATFDELVQDLDSLPKELDELFAHILRSLSASNLKRIYQTVSLVLCAQKYQLDLSLFAYTFLGRYNIDKYFAEADIQNAQKTSITGINSDPLSARKRLNGICKGLIEPVRDKESGYLASRIPLQETDRLVFAHRSIPEFFQSPEIAQNMDDQLEGFSPEQALSQLLLTEMWHEKGPWKSFVQTTWSIVYVMRMRTANMLDVAPYTYLQCLEKLAQKQQTEPPRDSWRSSHSVGYELARNNGSESYEMTRLFDTRIQNTINSPVIMSAWHGNLAYVAWKIEHDLALHHSQKDMYLIFLSLYGGINHGYDVEQRLELFSLLKMRGFSVNQPGPFCPLGFQPMRDTLDTSLSPWQHIVLDIIRGNIYGSSFGEPYRIHEKARIAEKLLELGAEKDLTIRYSLVSQNTMDLPIGQSESLSQVSEGFEPVKLTISGKGRDTLLLTEKITWSREVMRKPPVFDQNCSISLHDLFSFIDMPNKTRMLELLEDPVVEEHKEAAGNEKESEEQGEKRAHRNSNVRSLLLVARNLIGAFTKKRTKMQEADAMQHTRQPRSMLGMILFLLWSNMTSLCVFGYTF